MRGRVPPQTCCLTADSNDGSSAKRRVPTLPRMPSTDPLRAKANEVASISFTAADADRAVCGPGSVLGHSHRRTVLFGRPRGCRHAVEPVAFGDGIPYRSGGRAACVRGQRRSRNGLSQWRGRAGAHRGRPGQSAYALLAGHLGASGSESLCLLWRSERRVLRPLATFRDGSRTAPADQRQGPAKHLSLYRNRWRVARAGKRNPRLRTT